MSSLRELDKESSVRLWFWRSWKNLSLTSLSSQIRPDKKGILRLAMPSKKTFFDSSSMCADDRSRRISLVVHVTKLWNNDSKDSPLNSQHERPRFDREEKECWGLSSIERLKVFPFKSKFKMPVSIDNKIDKNCST